MAVDTYMIIKQPTDLQPQIPTVPVLDTWFGKAFPSPNVVTELITYSFSEVTPVTVGGGTTSPTLGKLQFKPLVVTRQIDAISPSLLRLSALGFALPVVQIYIRKPGGTTTTSDQPYLAYEFKTVYVTTLEWNSALSDDMPSEKVTLTYGSMSIGYRPQNIDGTWAKAPIKNGWSQILNQPTSEADTLPQLGTWTA